MKNICFVTRSMFAGGAERVIAQLANYLSNNNIKCEIITLDDERILYELKDDIEIIPIGKQSNNKVVDKIKRYREVRRTINSIKPDVVLTMPEDIGIYAILSLIGTGIPVVVSERNNPWVMPDVKLTRVLRKISYPFAKGIIFQTKGAQDFFSNSIKKKGIILKNPVDIKRIPERYDGVRDKTIVSIGRLHDQKNFELLIKAFKKFYLEHSDYRLIIYGEGQIRTKLERLIKELNITDVVDLPGRRKTVLEDIKKAGMFVLSSDYEGMPNVLIEAMCMGMPVISTDCPSGGPAELIINDENGLLVPVGDIDRLVDAMNTLTDFNFSKKLSENAYDLRKTLADIEIFEQWKQYLKETCK